jgi:hypothetical protein
MSRTKENQRETTSSLCHSRRQVEREGSVAGLAINTSPYRPEVPGLTAPRSSTRTARMGAPGMV